MALNSAAATYEAILKFDAFSKSRPLVAESFPETMDAAVLFRFALFGNFKLYFCLYPYYKVKSAPRF